MQHIILILGFLLLATPAWGQWWAKANSAAQKTTKEFEEGAWGPLLLFDADCTDLYDTPNTTDGTDVSDENNWDTFAKAVDVMGNLGDATQISGSPDGWCDATPWAINGTIVMATDEDLYIGPFMLPADGIFVHSLFATVGTNYNFEWIFDNSWDTSQSDFVVPGTPTTATTSVIQYFGPFSTVASDGTVVDSLGEHPILNTLVYLRLDLNGAATWAMNEAIYQTRK
jgi:hypothetical protein